ncbi:MAG: C40 family peptidase [Campylobacterota bacterium]|nr:C40 family peptidase [Campylobacterota bacterium]
MKKILFTLIITASSMVYAQTVTSSVDCKMHIDKVKSGNTQFILTLSHNEKCEIMIDHNKSTLTLMAKEHNITTLSHKTKTDNLIALAKSKIGNKYMTAKAGPDNFDCSGFVYYLFKSNDISIPRTSLNQSKSGKKLTREELKKGDILFFDTANRKHVNHSGVYLGEGKFIHSSSGKAYGVTISNLDSGFYPDKFRWGIRKIESE